MTIWIGAAVGLQSMLRISMVTTVVVKQAEAPCRLQISDESLPERDNFQHQQQQRRGHWHHPPPRSWQPMKGMNKEEVDQSRWKG